MTARTTIETAINELRACRNEAAELGQITKAERINASVLQLKALVAPQDNTSLSTLARQQESVSAALNSEAQHV